MPLLNLSSNLQLWYSSNAPQDDASKFDHCKETIVFFHPLFFDSTWLRFQFEDPRLKDNYNLIAFDARSSGRTQSKISPHRDAWVDAADVGLALELLAIPRCHVFAPQTNSVHAAYRFALLFPEKTLSLCLCQVPATIDYDWTVPACFELIESWCFPKDLSSIEQACLELGYLFFNGVIQSELEDEIVAWWEKNYPATKRTQFLENALTCISRQPVTDKMLQRIQVPVLVMHGENYIVNPIDQAESVASRLPNARFVVVKGGPEAFTMVPSCATIVNRVYTTFLSRVQSQAPAAKLYTPQNEKKLLTTALMHLSDIFEDPKIAKRNPTSLSFSMCSKQRVEENNALLKRFRAGEGQAVTALDDDGQPLRRVSLRHEDEWSETAFDSMIGAGNKSHF